MATASKAAAFASGGIYKKILAVQQQVDAVPKRGFNAFHKYHYATEADILTVKQVLNNNGLVVLPTTIEEEMGFRADGKSWAKVTILFTVFDTDSGEAFESRFTGYAEDNFDKAIYKATTGANKYFYLKFFGIATEDDPEREDKPVENRSRYGQQGSRGPVKFPANAPAAEKAARAEKAEAPESDKTVKRSQALVNANKILSLQKQYGLSNDEILLFGEIESIRDLAEDGQVDKLAEAYRKLASHVRTTQAKAL